MAKKEAVAENKKQEDGKSEALKLAIAQITKQFGDGSIMKLGENGIKSLEDLADLSSDELIEIIGEDTMSKHLAGRVIMKARELAYNISVDNE